MFTSEGRMDQEIDRQISAASTVVPTLYQSLVVKRAPSQKTRLSRLPVNLCSTLINGHELWVVTKRMRLWVQVAEMSFHHKEAGLSLRNGVRSTIIWEMLRVELLLLHINKGQLR